MTPGRAALGTLLRWTYYTVGILIGESPAVSVVDSMGLRGWAVGLAAAGSGGVVGLLLFAGQLKFGSRMADRAFQLFADLAREWGIRSGRIPPDPDLTTTDTTEDPR